MKKTKFESFSSRTKNERTSQQQNRRKSLSYINLASSNFFTNKKHISNYVIKEEYDEHENANSQRMSNELSFTPVSNLIFTGDNFVVKHKEFCNHECPQIKRIANMLQTFDECGIRIPLHRDLIAKVRRSTMLKYYQLELNNTSLLNLISLMTQSIRNCRIEGLEHALTQLFFVDLDPTLGSSIEAGYQTKDMEEFVNNRNKYAFNIGYSTITKNEMKCNACKKSVDIGESAITCRTNPLAKTPNIWHTECFKCRKCLQPLFENIFWRWCNSIYCLPHYNEILYKRCSYCMEIIVDRNYFCVEDGSQSQKYWHTKHLNCAKCGQFLQDKQMNVANNKDGSSHLYCIECLSTLWKERCKLCTKEIFLDETQISHENSTWHQDCFVCLVCSTSLINKSYKLDTKHNRPCCMNCLVALEVVYKCGICLKLIELKSTQTVRALDGSVYHSTCAVCSKCETQLIPQCIDKLPLICKRCKEANIKLNEKPTIIPEIKVKPIYKHRFHNNTVKPVISQISQKLKKSEVTSATTNIKLDNLKGSVEENNCGGCRKLLNDAFYEFNDALFCLSCYTKVADKICFRCKKALNTLSERKHCVFENRKWHTECFTCYICNISLNGVGFIDIDAEIYCVICGTSKTISK